MPRKNPPGSRPEDPGTLEHLTQDDITLLARFRDQITLEIDNYARIARIEDWKKCKSLEWRGFCKYIGRVVFVDNTILREDPGKPSVIGSAYNIPLLSALYDLYSELCFTLPGLPCRAVDFQAFANIPQSSLYAIKERVTPSGLEFRKKVALEQENSVAMAGESGRINPTMSLAWLNHFHGWTQAREVIHRDGGQIMDSGSWSGRFLGDNQKACSTPEGKERQGEAVLLPETT